MTLTEEMIACMKTLSDDDLVPYEKMAREWNPIRSEYINARIELLIAIDERKKQ